MLAMQLHLDFLPWWCRELVLRQAVESWYTGQTLNRASAVEEAKQLDPATAGPSAETCPSFWQDVSAGRRVEGADDGLDASC